MRANKTDPHDAAGLAQIARTGFFKSVHVKSRSAQGVRCVLTARAHLVDESVRLDNMIRGLCIAFGLKVGAGQGKSFVERARFATQVPGLGEAVTALLLAREALLARTLARAAKTSRACRILMSIPGVGVQTSMAFAAAVDDVERFKRSRTIGAYFGLVPRRHQSGETEWTGRIRAIVKSGVQALLMRRLDPGLMS